MQYHQVLLKNQNYVIRILVELALNAPKRTEQSVASVLTIILAILTSHVDLNASSILIVKNIRVVQRVDV